MVKINVFPKSLASLYLLLTLGIFGTFTPAQALVIETGKQSIPNPASNTNTVETKAGPSPFSMILVPNKTKLKTGETMEVGLFQTWQPGVKVKGPDIPQPFGDWVIVSHQESPKKFNSQTGAWEENDIIRMMTFLDGKVEIPALKAQFQVRNQTPVEYQSSVQIVEVEPKVNKKGELAASLRDIKKPIWMISIWQILLAVLLALALLAILAWYSRKAGLLGMVKKIEPIRPPEDVAREKLEALKKSDLLAQGNFKAYYIELTDILRHYLEGRYSISAPDRTTSELMKELKRILDRKDVSYLRDLLERSDMIKFAKASPDYHEIDSDWNLVKEFVEKTTQAYLDIQQRENKRNQDENKLVTRRNMPVSQGRIP